MNKYLVNISAFFQLERLRRDKRIVVFMVCLVIATALWFLNSLSKNYTTTVSYPVKFVSPPKNQFLANTPPNNLELKVEAFGFTLLRHKLSLSFSPIVLNLNSITKNLESESGSYNVFTRNLIRRISDQISSEINVLEVQPEVIRIVLDSLRTKTVPVKPNISTSFKPQFSLKDSIKVTPQKVRITGPAAVLDTLVQLYTKRRVFEKLEAGTEKTVEVVHPEKTTVMPQKVTLQIEVERFTEKELKIPVNLKNKPENVSVKLFPSEIKILFNVGLSEFEHVKPENFSAFVDYNSIEPGMESLDVKIDTFPGNVVMVRTVPEKIEFLIETKTTSN